MWLDLVTNLTPFYKLVLTLVISHCFGLPSLSRAGPQARSTKNLCHAITLKAQVGHRLGPQPHFLRAAQGHQAPARVFRGVEKRPSVGFSGGNVQTNGRNIVNMTPPGPGVSTRGKLQIHLSFFQFALLNNALCVRLNRKWEIGIFLPQYTFSPCIIISDKIIGGCPLSSFTFDIYLGTSWIQPTVEERFTIESISIQASCRKDVNRI